MSDYLGIEPLPFNPPKLEEKEGYEICARPGHNIITHCVDPKGHEGFHTYSPVPDDAVKMSDKLELVMRLMTTSCPDYTVGDFVTARPTCCIYHEAAKVIMDAQEILRVMRR